MDGKFSRLALVCLVISFTNTKKWKYLFSTCVLSLWIKNGSPDVLFHCNHYILINLRKRVHGNKAYKCSLQLAKYIVDEINTIHGFRNMLVLLTSYDTFKFVSKRAALSIIPILMITLALTMVLKIIRMIRGFCRHFMSLNSSRIHNEIRISSTL